MPSCPDVRHACAIRRRLYADRPRPVERWDGDLLRYLARASRAGLERLSRARRLAGLAAFIAKRFPVGRVVRFSSPWDAVGRDQRPAPWLFGSSATPPERWWAGRHLRENRTQLIAHADTGLRIPADHIPLFDGPLPPGKSPDQGDPYHTSITRLPQYATEWRTLYGRGH